MAQRIVAAVWGAIAGATLGSTRRGERSYRALNFYEPIPGRMAVSEGIDTWAIAARAAESPNYIAELAAHWNSLYAETAFGRANFELGVTPPLAGWRANPISDGSQALLRAVVWGLLRPGQPDEASRAAKADAEFDHGGEGVRCAMAVAALIAVAAVGGSVKDAVKAARDAVTPDGRGAAAIKFALSQFNGDRPFETYVTGAMAAAGTADPYDAAVALGDIVASILYGHTDFGRAIRLAAGIGGAAPIVAGVVGAAAGAWSGSLDREWLDPLGTVFVAGHELDAAYLPPTIDDLARAIEEAARPAPEPVAAVVELPVAEPEPEAIEPTGASADASESEAPAEPAEKALPAPEPELALPAPAESSTEAATPAEPAPPAESEGPSESDVDAMLAQIEDRQPPAAWARLEADSTCCVLPLGPIHVVVNSFSELSQEPGKSVQGILRFVNSSHETVICDPKATSLTKWPFACNLTSFRLLPGEQSEFPFVARIPEDAPPGAASKIQIEDSLGTCAFPVFARGLWYTCGPFDNMDGNAFDRVFRCEDVLNQAEVFNGRNRLVVKWTPHHFNPTFYDLEPLFMDGAGAMYLYGSLTMLKSGRYRVVVASAVGVVVRINNEPIVRYHDTHRPNPRAVVPYVGEFDASGPFELMVKVLRNREPIPPVVLYFLDASGRVVQPAHFDAMP